MNYERFEKKVLYCILIFTSIFFILPFIVFGANSIITVHDNLDQIIPYYKMFKDNHLFFKFDAPTRGFSGMSTLYYNFINYSFPSLLYYLFDDFTAYTINYTLALAVGFASMLLLLKKIPGMNIMLAAVISALYCVLPVAQTYSIAINAIPLFAVFFLCIAKKKTFAPKTLLLFFYPFFSSFTYAGIFLLCFWIAGTIIAAIHEHRINPNLLAGFILLCLGYVLVDLRLFYVMFVLKTTLNRSVFTVLPVETIAQIKTFLRGLWNYGVNGYYHAASFQKKIIIPTAFFASLFCLSIAIKRVPKQQGKLPERIKTAITESALKTKLLFIMEIAVLLICCAAALYDSGVINGFIKKYIPVLNGFNWGRVWIFNRILWYIIFALCLQFMLEIDSVVLKTRNGNAFEKAALPAILFRACALMLVCLQLGYIMLSPVLYNDSIKTYFNALALKTSLAKKIFPNKRFDSFITYKEFFAKDLFDKIKKDISYSGEPAAALGYHPSVLMYNGFNCVDGYNNAYPLSYMRRFRTLIAPELEINAKAREYYDMWGGRMYLYNADLSYQPTRNKDTRPVTLNIDMDVFRNDFKGKYILSRAEIANSAALGLTPAGRYYDEGSIYTIYVYAAN